MTLLEKINASSIGELDGIITEALEEKISGAESNKRLGFQEGGYATSKIPVHKGFISLDSKIKFDNWFMGTYSMATKDFYYEFARFIKTVGVNNNGFLVKSIENFINDYFGQSSGVDLREDYFSQILDRITADDEYFEKLESFEIGDFKGKNIAMCTERAALAQNLLSLFGFSTFYCMGYLINEGKTESHCFNIVRAKNAFMLVDYSMPVAIFENGKVIDYAPFEAEISLDDIKEVLLNGKPQSFLSYEFHKVDKTYKRVNGTLCREYAVGSLLPELSQPKL